MNELKVILEEILIIYLKTLWKIRLRKSQDLYIEIPHRY